jgi:branched-chain amino acid transport system ATP-binding protein
MLEVIGLHAGYATGGVLHGVDVTVGASEAVALLGRNGMGKTTLLRAIGGLRPPHPTGGRVTFAGAEILGWPSERVARAGIGLVPQGRRVFRSLSVEENLRVVARPGPAGWDARRVFELFPGLAERARQRAATLSGGEQQMLAIGRALMTNPRLLLMDEPSEGLAPSVIEVILERLRHLKGAGQAVLLAEQNVDLALELADRVVVLGEGGTIAWSGSPTALAAKPTLLDELIGLAVPTAAAS